MEDNENPYTILGVDKGASHQEIKSAYRKLALKHHPDKQSSDEGRKQATVLFAKISNAYEILGDDVQRQNYDRDTAYAKVNRPRSKMPRGNNNGHDFDFFHQTHFHDPFSVFESVFRDEFGAGVFGNNNGSFRQQQQNRGMPQNRRSAFNDPFFGGGSLFNDPFFGGSGFGRDPFMGSGMMGGPFGGGIFAAMNQHVNEMVNMQHQQQLPRQSNQTFVYSSSSSSNLMGGARGERVTNSTTTRIINGKRQVVTERVVHKADGTVERHVDVTGDDDFPERRQQLPSTTNAPRQALEAPPKESRRRSSKAKALFKRKRRDSSNLEG